MLAGDSNADGHVDFADFLALSSRFGDAHASWEHGDFDGDGTVAFSDFLALSSNFGLYSPPRSVELLDANGEPISQLATVLVDELGRASVEIDLEARKTPTENVFFVDEAATPSGDGRDWKNAFADIPDALNAISEASLANATIYVAAGGYTWGDISNPGFHLNVVGNGIGSTFVNHVDGNTYAAQMRAKDVYVEGVSFVGGETVFDVRNVQNVTFVDSEFTGATLNDGLNIINVASVVVYGSRSSLNFGDGFSYTNPGGEPMNVFEAFVNGSDNGLSSLWNSQGSTAHKTVDIVRVGSVFERNPTNISDVSLGTSWNVDVRSSDPLANDQGEQFLSLNVSNEGTAWIVGGDYSYGSHGPVAINAQPGAQIRYLNVFRSEHFSNHTGDVVLDNSPWTGCIEDEPPTFDISAFQLESISDRVITATGYDDFRSTVKMPSTSPALVDVIAGDLVVDQSSMPGESFIAVVLKPRQNTTVHQIPVPGPEADIHSFLAEQFELAVENDASTILFPPNHIFDITPPTPTTPHLNLKRLTDIVVDLNGSTLKMTQFSMGIRVTESQRIEIKNGTIRGHGVLASIARVVPDDSEAGVHFELLPDFRIALESTTDAPAVLTIGAAEQRPDGSFGIRVEEYADMFVNRGGSSNNFNYQDGNFVGTSALNSSDRGFGADMEFAWLLHQNNSAHGIFFANEDGVEDVSISNVTFENIPGMAITGEIVRGLHVDGIRISKNENDPLAIFGASSDGIHINANGGDIIVERSEFGPNADDKINIKGNYWQVTSIDRDNNIATVEPAGRPTSVNRWGWANDRVVFLDGDYSVLGEATLGEDSIRRDSKIHDVPLVQIPDNIQVGSIIGNTDRGGGRIIVRNNQFADTRAQGILVQTSHVAIQNNAFEGIAGPAIKLNVGLEDWYEAINTTNILIQNNTFQRVALSTEKSHEIINITQSDMSGNAVDLITDVAIELNRIEELDAIFSLEEFVALSVVEEFLDV